ncbi:ASCH domain-containing protein [Brochothrix campestris]|uniref:ASCH domain-containing protein n=1 Tax=Brochothrix campestris FSL F6-1037 TaxID=1265861 RepID=W7CXB6_9LIST|nr:ASCH domain-containing protein [Brochothrix campestris]EUJ41345.1 hypothetical protein BCAMP_03515 [Brochothrix campestris FSL F6-1037]
MNEQSITAMWANFKRQNPAVGDDYAAWSFGDSPQMADALAQLVLKGIKTATSSAYDLYEDDNALPYPGLYNVVLDGNGEAVAIIETTDVQVVYYEDVTAEFAYLEGEGDRSITHWREAHRDFFIKELGSVDLAFTEKMGVVLEKFKVVFK